MNDMTIEDREGLLYSSRQRFADAQFGDLDDKWSECSATEDFALTALTFLLGISPVLVVIYFALS